MEKNKLILLATTGALLLGLSSAKSFAEEAQKKTDETKTEVTFKKQGSTLVLNHVPDTFKFDTEVSNKTYRITSGDIEDKNETFKNQVVVFNNNSDQEWKVSVSLSELKEDKYGAKITNPELKITSEKRKEQTSTTGTGENNIVFENAGVTTENNIGTFTNTIKGIEISFEDLQGKIKADSTVAGTVTYTLVAANTPS